MGPIEMQPVSGHKPLWFTKIPGEHPPKNDKSSRTPEMISQISTVLAESECTNSIQLDFQHRSPFFYIYIRVRDFFPGTDYGKVAVDCNAPTAR